MSHMHEGWRYQWFYQFLCFLCRSEIKLWSPLSSEGGKTHPYKMNLESEPKVICVCVCVCVCACARTRAMCFLSHVSNVGKVHLKRTIQFLKGCTLTFHNTRNRLFLAICQWWSHCLLPNRRFPRRQYFISQAVTQPSVPAHWVESWGQSVTSCRKWFDMPQAPMCTFSSHTL